MQVTMSTPTASLRQRKDIRELEKEYLTGNKKPLSDLLRAWKGIQELDPQDFYSFFVIAGYHGEPFRGAGWGNPQWWGGYCNHGNVLFPTWHRAYLWRLENALRSIKGCENVTLPYWNEIDQVTKEEGLPRIFLSKQVELDDGTKIDNPLYSYKFGAPVNDNLVFPPIVSSSGGNVFNPNPDYSKPKGYVTKRYPYSGLVGPEDEEATKIHNQEIDALGEAKVNQLLNENVQGWLNQFIILHDGTKLPTGTRQKYLDCLDAPNYTVFSNLTSATQWNQDHSEPGGPKNVVPLESPHNDIHLSVGGFQFEGLGDFDTIAGANGDMGENDTASFDPIFFFHHCFVDKVFWMWQQKTNNTNTLDIKQGYPGTNSVDSQGPTPGVPGNTWLGMYSPLDPFTLGLENRPLTSTDVVNIETQLGYTYIETPTLGDGKPSPGKAAPPAIHAKISGVNRGSIGGSFVLAAYKEADGKKTLLGFESILSRWHISDCANCQTHQNVKVILPLHGLTDEEAKDPKVSKYAEVIGRQNKDGNTLIGPKPPKPDLQLGARY